MRPVLAVLVVLVGAPLVLAVCVLAAGACASLLIEWRAGAAYPPAGPFVSVRGGRLAALRAGPETGARGTVVLIHGASANAADPMEGVGRTLAVQGFRVIAFDRPGHGWSDRLGAVTPAAQADRIAEALATLAAGPVIVLGHSWGGAVALALALDHPEQVSALALVAPVALPFPRQVTLPWYWRLAAKPPVAWLLSRTLGPPLALYHLRGAAAHAFRPQPAAADYLDRARVPLALRPAALLANVEDLMGLPAALEQQSPRYATLGLPVLVVSGDADPLVRIEAQAEPLADRIPGARLLRLPGIGHMVPWAAADRLAEAVGDLAPVASATR